MLTATITNTIISGMAPDIFSGNCVFPCTFCVRKQVRKGVAMLQQNYPQEYSLLVKRYGQNHH